MPPKIPYRQIKINLTPEDFQRVEEAAAAAGISKAEWIRRRINAKIENAPSRNAPQKCNRTDPKTLRLLKNIGNNINQIAAFVNTRKQIDYNVLKMLVAVEQQLNDLFLSKQSDDEEDADE